MSDITKRVLGWRSTIIPFRWVHITVIEYQGEEVGAEYEYKWAWGRPSPLKVSDLVPTLPEFDWLKDYGPMWEPASTAFWLAPETELEVREWYRKYRFKEYLVIYGYHGYQSNALAKYQNMLRSQYSQNRNLGGLSGNIF